MSRILPSDSVSLENNNISLTFFIAVLRLCGKESWRLYIAGQSRRVNSKFSKFILLCALDLRETTHGGGDIIAMVNVVP